MSIGFNINADSAPNRQALIEWHARARPAWSLVMDDAGLGLCDAIKASSPQTEIIHRDYGVIAGGDDGLHRKVDPALWVRGQRDKLLGRYWAYAGNEPGFDADLLKWTLTAAQEAVRLQQPVVILNLAVGNPQDIRAWKDAHPVLELACMFPQYIAIGLHEYFLGVPTSGFVGGNPDGTVSGEPGRVVHADFTRDWPTEPLSLGMLWHCGRVKAMLDYCAAQEWNRPRVVITEHGADNLRDLEAWRKALPAADGFNEIRGWHSLAKYWGQLTTAWTAERFFFEALAYLDRWVYRPLGIEGQLIFSWTNNPEWKRMFDVSDSLELLDCLASHNRAQASPTPASPPAVVPTPPPDTPEGQPLTDFGELSARLADAEARIQQLEIDSLVYRTLLAGLGQLFTQVSKGKATP